MPSEAEKYARASYEARMIHQISLEILEMHNRMVSDVLAELERLRKRIAELEGKA